MRSGVLPLHFMFIFSEVQKMNETMNQAMEMLMGFMKREQAEKIERAKVIVE